MPVTGPAVAVTLLNYGTTVPDHARCAGSRDGRPQAGIPSVVRKMKRKREEGGGFAPSRFRAPPGEQKQELQGGREEEREEGDKFGTTREYHGGNG